MDSLSMRASPTLSEASIRTCTIEHAGPSSMSSRNGVEAREVVLRQFQLANDIVVIPSDENEKPLAKRRRLDTHSWLSCDENVHTQTRYTPKSVLTASNPYSPSQPQMARSKKRLFHTTETTRSIAHQSDLPTPPTSPYDVLYVTGGDDNSTNGKISNTPILLTQGHGDGDATVTDAVEAEELSIQLSHMFDPPKPLKSLAAEDTTINPYKARLEALGVERSRASRQQRRKEITGDLRDNAKQSSSLPSDSGVINNTIGGTTNRNSVSKNKSLANTSMGAVSDKGQQSRSHINSYASHDKKISANGYATRPLATKIGKDIQFEEPAFQIIESYSRPRTLPQASEADRISLLQKSTPVDDSSSDDGIEHERLHRVKTIALTSSRLKQGKSPSPCVTRQGPLTFCMPDLSNGRRSKPESVSRCQRDLRNLMGLGKSTTTSSVNDRPIEADLNEDRPSLSICEVPDTSSPVSMSRLRKFHSQNQTGTKDVYDDLQPQGSDLCLRRGFELESEEVQMRIRQREIYKERGRDFRMISKTFEEVATLGALRSFNEIELKELHEIRKFCSGVFEENLSGKRARGRISEISANARKRIKAVGKQPSPHRVDEVLQSILKPEYLQILKNEGEEIKEKLRQMSKDPPKISVTGSSKLTKGTSRDLSDQISRPSAILQNWPKRNRITKTDQKIAQVENILARFKEHEASYNDNKHVTDGDEVDLGGYTSEEEEGQDLIKPIGFSGYQGNEEHVEEPEKEILEDAQTVPSEKILTDEQEQPALSQMHNDSSASSQMYDQSLINTMRMKQQEHAHLRQQQAQLVNYSLLKENLDRRALRTAAEKKSLASPVSAGPSIKEGQAVDSLDPTADEEPSDQEFEDSDLDIASNEDENDEDAELVDEYARPQCWRYIVKLIECIGFGFTVDTVDSLGSQELVQGRFAKYDRARKHLDALVVKLRQTYQEHHQTKSDRCWTTQIEEDDEKYDLVMTHVDDSARGCHLRIERELYTPSMEAYEKTKIKTACQPIDAWFVDWERIVYPNDGYAEDDELFEEEESPEQADREDKRGGNEEEGEEASTVDDHRQKGSEECSEQSMQQTASNDGDIADAHETPLVQPGRQSKEPSSRNTFPSDSSAAEPYCTAEQSSAEILIEPCSEAIDHGVVTSPSPVSVLTLNEEIFDTLLDEELFGSDQDAEDSPVQTSPPSDKAEDAEIPTITSLFNKSPQLHINISPSNTSVDLSETAIAIALTPPTTAYPHSSNIQSFQGSAAAAAAPTPLGHANPPVATVTTRATAITTVNTDAETDNNNDNNGSDHDIDNDNDNNESKASRSNSPLQPELPPQMQLLPAPKKTRLNGDELRVFSSIAHANRYASECFLNWYTQHASVAGNERLIAVTMSDIEEELAFNGHLQLWAREEEFTFVSDEGCEMVDRFKVWVRKAECRGPRN